MEAEKAIAEFSRRDFYVYVHRRETDGSVFYVGKGCGRRAFKSIGRNPHWKNVVAKHGFTAEFVADGMTEQQALAKEAELIDHFGMENLCNLTRGGVGTAGFHHSDEAKRVIGEFHLGRKRSAETKARLSAAQMGRVVSDTARSAISAKLKGQVLSAETRRKMSDARTGLRHTDQSREKMRQGWTLERRAMIGIVSREAKSVPVECVETSSVFPSMQAAVAWLREMRGCAGHSHISSCCNGKRKAAYGYHWRFAA